ncbi:TPA: ShlB/FhaC/HecB family hemolysin secretion/activation protein, partial [Klebsiella quasipneumoniae]|nr:ShlB/FhaC/HecB family hemolysin secretion/activation protein [Klebsiella quasipneumoniae]
MLCLPSARYGLLLAALISAGLSAAPLSPADQNAIEQQQKALLEQSQQQRDMLRYTTPAPSLPKAASPEATGPCLELRHIRLENVTVLPRSVQRKLTAIPAEGCMTLKDIQLRVRDVTQDYLSRGFITSRAWLP